MIKLCAFADLDLVNFIHSYQDSYYPEIQKDLLNFNQAIKGIKQDHKQDKELYQTKSSLQDSINIKIPKRIMKILTAQGKKYVQVEIQSNQPTLKRYKAMNYQQIKNQYPELLVGYFQQYMLSN